MSDAFDIENLRAKLARVMAAKGMKPTTLSLRVGRSPTLVKDLLEKTTDTKLSTIYKLAEALDVPVSTLIGPDAPIVPAGPELFVKGEVAAGQWVDAYEWPRDEWLSMPGRPDIVAAPEHRFFLRVRGDSMNEIYPEGTFVECVSIFGHAEPTPGKRVVVIRERIDGLVEATVKQLVEIGGDLWLVPRSTNPAHSSIKVSEAAIDDIAEVRIVAVVVSSVRPE